MEIRVCVVASAHGYQTYNVYSNRLQLADVHVELFVYLRLITGTLFLC